MPDRREWDNKMEISPDITESKIKNAIEEEFITLSRDIAPYLRVLLKSRMPGNLPMVFEEFKKHLDSLFMLTSNKKELKKETIESINKYLNTRHKPTTNDMEEGLRLFNDYKAELFRMNVIKIG